MEIEVHALSGEVAGTATLDDRIFAMEPNQAVLHQAVVTHLANRRQGTADTRTRAEVAGSGHKAWRQKGTGRARQGSRRAPHWRGGGVVFGPHPHSYRLRLPRKMRRLALRSALSDKVADGALTVVDRFDVSDGRTRTLKEKLQALDVEGNVLLVLGEPDPLVRRAAGNLPNVFVALPNGFSLLDILQADRVLMTQQAIQDVTRLLLQNSGGKEVVEVQPSPVLGPSARRPASPKGRGEAAVEEKDL